MAFTSEDEVKKALQGGQAPQQQGIDPTSGISGGGGQGGQFVTSGAGGMGAAQGSAVGGAKPFVNIQSYLQGNQPSESEANIIQGDASNITGQERGAVTQAAQNTRAQGEQERAEKIGVDKATQIIQGAAQGQGDTSQIRQSLDATFDRPTFDYSMGGQFRSAQEALSQNPQQFANQAYGRAIDGSLSQGQRLLQGQLDAVNPFVQQSLQGAGQQFQDTQDFIGQQGEEIGGYINDLAQAYMQADQGLRSGLSQYGQSQMTEAERRMNEYNTQLAQSQDRYNQGLAKVQSDIGRFQDLSRQDRQNNQYNIGYFEDTMKTPQVNSAVNDVLKSGVNIYSTDALNMLERRLAQSGAPAVRADFIWKAMQFNQREADRQRSIQGFEQQGNTIRQSDLGESFNLYGANPEAVRQFNLIAELLGQNAVQPGAQGRAAKLTF